MFKLKTLAVIGLASVVVVSCATLPSQSLPPSAKALPHQEPSAESVFTASPAAPPEAVAGGRQLFLNSCAHCHGIDARGDEGPDLHDLQVGDQFIANTIKQGIEGEMPSFAQKHNDAEIAKLVAYVRSLK
jgi:mono/diheme cytochrome c family protein